MCDSFLCLRVNQGRELFVVLPGQFGSADPTTSSRTSCVPVCPLGCCSRWEVVSLLGRMSARTFKIATPPAGGRGSLQVSFQRLCERSPLSGLVICCSLDFFGFIMGSSDSVGQIRFSPTELRCSPSAFTYPQTPWEHQWNVDHECWPHIYKAL